MSFRLKSCHGVSLIELCTALSLSTALLGMVLPSWQQAAHKGRRGDAHALSQQVEAAQSAHFQRHSRYASTLAALAPFGAQSHSPAGHYQARLLAADGLGYTLQVQASPSSPQAGDTACSQFQLSVQRGSLRHHATSAGGGDSTTLCWGQ